MADLQKFAADLKAEHDALTQAFESAQVKAEQQWADAEAKASALTAFRSKYGRVLKLFAEGAVQVEG